MTRDQLLQQLRRLDTLGDMIVRAESQRDKRRYEADYRRILRSINPYLKGERKLSIAGNMSEAGNA